MTVTIMIEKAHRGNRQMCQKWNTKIAHLWVNLFKHTYGVGKEIVKKRSCGRGKLSLDSNNRR